jgi:hypothetical protein
MRRPSFRILLVLALLASFASFGIPWIALADERALSLLIAARIAFVCAGLWGVCFLATLVLHRLKGLWLLLTAPILIWWPAVLISIALKDCRGRSRCSDALSAAS